MWLPYNTNQELSHLINIFISCISWIPSVYTNYTLIAVLVTLIALLPICLWFWQIYCSRNWKKIFKSFLTLTIVYARPNRYREVWFLKFNTTIDFYKEFGVGIFLIAVSHFFPLFILSKLFLLFFIIFLPIVHFRHGYDEILTKLIYIVLLNIGYYYNFGIGLPVIPPHYYIEFLSYWFPFINGGKPITINPYDYVIDINKYMYVYALIFLYLATVRHILNFFFWKKIKYVPFQNPKFKNIDLFEQKRRVNKIHKLKKQLTKRREKAILNGTYVAKSKVNNFSAISKDDRSDNIDTQNGGVIDNSVGGSIVNNNSDVLRSLKLLAFKQSAIQVMLAEYGSQIISQALDKLDQIENLSNPKAQFIEILEESSDA